MTGLGGEPRGLRWWALVGWAVAGVLSLACWSPPARVEDVRPIRFKVVDARTGEPLARVPVAYGIQTMLRRGRFLGLIPALEPDLGQKLAYVERGETDPRGEVSFAVRGLHLPGNERLDQEIVFVNVGVDLDDPASRRVLQARGSGRRRDPRWYGDVPDDVYVAWSLSNLTRHEVYRNPVLTHRGVIVTSIRGGGGPGYGDRTGGGGRFRAKWNCASLEKRSDVVVVALDPAPPVQSP